jgi:hypothetical protein
MNLADGLDLAADLLPRKARHVVGLGVLILALCYPIGLVHFVTWYAAQKSHAIVQQIEQLLPVPQQSPPGGSSSVQMINRRLDRAGT